MTSDGNSMMCLDYSLSGPFTSIFYLLKYYLFIFGCAGSFYLLFIKIYLFILIGGFIVAQRLSLLAESGHYSLVVVQGLLTAIASLVADHAL